MGSVIRGEDDFDSLQAVRTGLVLAYAVGSNIPNGFLECNGAELSRTTYANLFAVIGTTYGVGDGSTTFNLPDLRGEFIRGFDNGRGVDNGRIIGSSQLASLTNVLNGNDYGNDSNYIDLIEISDTDTANHFDSTEHIQAKTIGIVTGQNAIPEHSFRTMRQIRPRNIAMMYCIKY